MGTKLSDFFIVAIDMVMVCVKEFGYWLSVVFKSLTKLKLSLLAASKKKKFELKMSLLSLYFLFMSYHVPNPTHFLPINKQHTPQISTSIHSLIQSNPPPIQSSHVFVVLIIHIPENFPPSYSRCNNNSLLPNHSLPAKNQDPDQSI